MTNSRQVLIDIIYLDLGLIPMGNAYDGKEGDRLRAHLASMDNLMARAHKRKFRKILRRAVTAREIDIRKSHSQKVGQNRISRSLERRQTRRDIKIFHDNLGWKFAGEDLTQHHAAQRRRLVLHFISDQLQVLGDDLYLVSEVLF